MAVPSRRPFSLRFLWRAFFGLKPKFPLDFAQPIWFESQSTSAATGRRLMLEDRLKKRAIEGMFAATEHIRDCVRCRRVYGVAFDVLLQEGRLNLLNPFSVYSQCSRELHECEHWPKGI